MAIESPLTLLVLSITPIVVVFFAGVCWFKRDTDSQPSVVAAVPLGLTSLTILLGLSAIILLRTFQEIATKKTAGMNAVIDGLLRAQRPLIWALYEFGIGLIVLVGFSAYLRFRKDVEAPLLPAYIPLPALIATVCMVIAAFLALYFEYGTVDLVMKIVDTHRNQELVQQFGTTSPANFARMVSARLLTTAGLTIPLFIGLIVTGVLGVFWQQQRESSQTFTKVFIAGTLVVCGLSALEEMAFVDYLLRVHK